MIVSIQGVLAECTALRAVVEVAGLGYEVHIPVTTAERLPAVGSAVKLHTLSVYREDSQSLYGFATAADRDFFRLMVEHVTGIGPKLALTIMSRMALPALRSAIQAGDLESLSRCPGIGKKTAERLVLELRSKLDGASAPAVAAGPDGDAVSALIALGYKPAEADGAVRKARRDLGEAAPTEALVKRALAG